jgi:F-type H+-transporting ATPase subunit c
LLTGLVVLLFAPAVFADTATDNAASEIWGIALGAGLGIGIAALGGALAQGKAAVAALEGIARNPGASGKIFTPMILGLALIESLVIYALIIAIMLQGKIPTIVLGGH